MKTALLIPVLVAFQSLTLSLASFADGLPKLPPPPATNDSPFRQEIQDDLKTCPNLKCHDSELELVILDAKAEKNLPQALRDDFTNVAYQIAVNEWPDTILEGPYAAAFKPVIDQVAYIFRNDTELGYFISFHDQAWQTDNCNYDPQQPDSVKGCQAGQFVESAFIRVDLEESFRNPADFVTFIPSK